MADPLGQDSARAEAVRSNARLRVLAEVSRAFATVATDLPSLLQKIARTSADLVGDGCTVTLLEADGETLVNVANAHRDPVQEASYRESLTGRGVSKTTSAAVSAVVARFGEPKLVADIDPYTLVAQTDEALRPLVARLNVSSYAVVPIRARQAVIGTLSLVRSAPGHGYTAEDIVLLQDVADRAGMAIETARLYGDMERQVAERTAELRVAMQQLEAFSSSASHDLRAPLRAIGGFSEILAKEHGDALGKEGRRLLDRVRDGVRHMSDLIDGLLALSRVVKVELKRAAVDISALAHEVARELREAEHGRLVEVSIQPGLRAVGDRALLRVVMTNLLSNAFKFTARCPATRIDVGGNEATDGQIVFFVRDNGAGFDLQKAERLFGVFQRFHREQDFPGTGVGLATVQRVIERHGGRIWAEAQPDHGATFCFTLPGAARTT